MNNQYCRDYLMHAKKGGFFNSLVSFGESLADKNAAKKKQQAEYEAQRVAGYAAEQQQNLLKNSDYQKQQAAAAQEAAAARSTKDALAGQGKKVNAMSGDPRFQTNGSFDKDKYNKWYYALDPSKWRKGGEYYERARQKVKSGIRKLTKVGESVYDRTHRTKDPITGRDVATIEPYQRYKGANSQPNFSYNVTKNLSTAKGPRGTDWSSDDIAKRQQGYRFRQSHMK